MSEADRYTILRPNRPPLSFVDPREAVRYLIRTTGPAKMLDRRGRVLMPCVLVEQIG
jgi:hypothetical protein